MQSEAIEVGMFLTRLHDGRADIDIYELKRRWRNLASKRYGCAMPTREGASFNFNLGNRSPHQADGTHPLPPLPSSTHVLTQHSSMSARELRGTASLAGTLAASSRTVGSRELAVLLIAH